MCNFLGEEQKISLQDNTTKNNTPIYSSVKKKVSTAVGTTSSTTGTNSIGSNSVKNVSDGAVQTYETLEEVKSALKSAKVSTSCGTSPPPQNISTQVSIFEILTLCYTRF